jgi:hypothetical protein
VPEVVGVADVPDTAVGVAVADVLADGAFFPSV